jgi:hypothetical protein
MLPHILPDGCSATNECRELGDTHADFVVLGRMGLVAFLMILFFYRKGWFR